MKVVPENDTVLAFPVNKSKHQAEANGFVYNTEDLPVFQIISVCDDEVYWKPGDKIICNSTGTKLNLPGDEVQYLFKTENIAGRIID